MLSDIEISQQNQPEPIERIAEKAGLCEEDLELYGRYKAKIGFAKLRELAAEPLKGKLILVTAITPTRPVRENRQYPSAWPTLCSSAAKKSCWRCASLRSAPASD